MSTPGTSASGIGVGDVIAGKYRVERVLGRGAMGEVYAATHIALGQRVAIKVLLASLASHQALHERFLREARAVVPLRSQHVTRVSDVGMLESGAPYLAMELLDGRDLSALLDERGRLPIQEAVEYVLQACEAVGEAHKNGIVHRDLKPANLFLTTHADGTPCVKVLDFGVAKVVGSEGLKVTTEGQAVGSPLYMSPEQMLGRQSEVDERSDIWALGVILYELIAGRTPFHSETMGALQAAVLVMPPAPLTQYLPDAPPQLEAVILRCIDKERDRRWRDVAAFAAALVPFAPPRAVAYATKVASVRGVTVEPSRPAAELSLEAARMRASQPAATVPAITYGVTTTGATASQPASTVPKARRGWVAAGLVVGLIAVVLGVAGAMRAGAGSSAAATATSASGPVPTVAPAAVSAALSVEPARAAEPVPTVAPAPGTAPTATATAAAAAPAKSPAAGRLPVTKAPAPTPRPAPPSGDLYDRGDKR